MVKVNSKKLMFEINSELKKHREMKRFSNRLNKAFRAEFYALKESFIMDVLESPVVQDIKNGTNTAKVITGYRKNPPPSLFGFLGFNAGDDPVKDLEGFLKKYITSRGRLSGVGVIHDGGFRIDLTFPNTKDVREFTKGELKRWSSLSWVYAIETGDISNIKYYLAGVSTSASYSKQGIQSKNKVNIRAKFTPTKFFTPLLMKFMRDVNKLHKKYSNFR